MSVYDSFLPLIRLLKISLIGVADFTVGLTMAMILDQAFGKIPIPPALVDTTTSMSSAEIAALAAARWYPTISAHGVTIQNPLVAGTPIYDFDQMKVVGLTTLAQLVVTLVAGLELRNLFVPYENFLDPTGGIVFVVALLAQPLLWQRSMNLIQSVYRALWWFEQPERNQS